MRRLLLSLVLLFSIALPPAFAGDAGSDAFDVVAPSGVVLFDTVSGADASGLLISVSDVDVPDGDTITPIDNDRAAAINDSRDPPEPAYAINSTVRRTDPGVVATVFRETGHRRPPGWRC